MNAGHLEVLTEERSMEAFLQTILSRMLPRPSTFRIHSFRGKKDLLRKLQNRLHGYANWIPDNYRVVVVVDRDNDNCRELKEKLNATACRSGLVIRSPSEHRPWQVLNRIAIEELEAWYFGDWPAVCQAYPRVSPNIPARARYRNPDAIRGGTWEAFERIMQKHGYFTEGLGKVAAARAIANYFDPECNQSPSFAAFRDALTETTE